MIRDGLIGGLVACVAMLMQRLYELERRLDQSLTQGLTIGAPYVVRRGWNDMLPFYDYWA